MKNQIQNNQSAILSSVYDDMAATYSNKVKDFNYIGPSWVIENIRTSFCGQPRVLDLGCANGIIGEALKVHGIAAKEIIGIDLSAEMVKACQQTKLYSQVRQHDLSTGLSLEADEKFDIVVFMGVSEFLPNNEKLLTQIADILIPGGQLWATYQIRKKDDPSVQKYKKGILKYLFNESELRDMYNNTQLKIEVLDKRIAYKSPSSQESIEYFFIRALKSLHRECESQI